VGNTISCINYDTSGLTRGIKGKYGLDTHIKGWYIEGFKHDLSHFLSIRFRVHRSLSQHDRSIIRFYSEFSVETMMPDLFHIIPILNHTMFNGIVEGKDTSFSLSVITYETLFLVSSHDIIIFGSTYDSREAYLGSFFTGDTSLAHTTSIINNNRFVTHF
jgi:hypothetical protein